MMTKHRHRTPWLGALALLIAACSAGDEGGAKPGPTKPAPTSCNTVSDCPTGTKACVSNFCVSQECPDADGDGAGVGPGCATFDCDDSDPSVPAGSEVCDNAKDDDCDGLVDEGCPCKDDTGVPVPDGSTRACGGNGDCAGVQTCESNEWSATCEGGRAPTQEICGNTTDENCDGKKDEGCCPGTETVCTGTAVCSSNGICN